MIDLIELTESQYVELNYTTGYIWFAYHPCNHLIFTKFIKTKSADVTAECLKELFTYLENDKIQLRDISYVTSDEGTEFLGAFSELLAEEKIKYRRVNSEKQDHLMLAPLNSMCRYVRNNLVKRFIEVDQQS